MTALSPYAKVFLESDAYEAEGVTRGMVGYVLETYWDGKYEVEFSDSTTGVTIALLVMGAEELRVAPE